MNDDQLVEAYTGGGAGLPGLRAVELAACAALTAQLQIAQATIAAVRTVFEQAKGNPVSTLGLILSRADTSAYDAAIRAAKAEALREAADRADWLLAPGEGFTTAWLRSRARSIEQTEGK